MSNAWEQLLDAAQEFHDLHPHAHTYDCVLCRALEPFLRSQDSLFDEPVGDPPPLPAAAPSDEAHARATDPRTSWDAARSLTPDQLKQNQQAVLACYLAAGPMTHEEMLKEYKRRRASATVDWPHQSDSGLRTRSSELEKAGFIRDTGRTRRLTSGRHGNVYEADVTRAFPRPAAA